MKKETVEAVLFALCLTWMVYGFSVMAALTAQGADMPIIEVPKTPAPLCAGVQCLEVK